METFIPSSVIRELINRLQALPITKPYRPEDHDLTVRLAGFCLWIHFAGKSPLEGIQYVENYACQYGKTPWEA